MPADGRIDPSIHYQHQQTYPQRGPPPTTTAEQLPYFLANQQQQADQRPPPIDPNLQSTPSITSASPGDAHSEDHDDDEHADEQNPSGDNVKRSRACDNCRQLKVRCDPSEDPADPKCQRCKRTRKNCVTTPPTKKRQKKDNSLINQLKQQVEDLTAIVQGQQGAARGSQDVGYPGLPQYGNMPNFPSTTLPYVTNPAQNTHSPPSFSTPPGARTWSQSSQNPNQTTSPNNKRRRSIDASQNKPERKRSISPPINPKNTPFLAITTKVDHTNIPSLVDNWLSPEMIAAIVDHYRSNLCRAFPAVPLPPTMTVEELRQRKPILFLAIISSASFGLPGEQKVPKETQTALAQLFKDQMADIIWRNGEKSLEIIQALQVSVLWYRAPPNFEQHAFYLMANTATIIALDLGLSKKTDPNIAKIQMGPYKRTILDAAGIEARRAILVCFYMTLSITMVLRRPIVMHWSKYLDECMEVLETSPDAAPTDKLLCSHFRFVRLAEEVATQFALDDPSAAVTMADKKVVYNVKGFQKQFEELKKHRKHEDTDETVMLSDDVLNLLIHEVALHTSTNIDDFRAPYTGGAPTDQDSHEVFGQAHIDALGQCLTSCHGLLDTFVTMRPSLRFTMPVIFCVRTIYAIVCLMKMWVAIAGPGNIGTVINKEDLKIEEYLEKVVRTFKSVKENDTEAPHAKFAFISGRLVEKFAKIKMGAAADVRAGDGPAPPIKKAKASSNEPVPPQPRGLQMLSDAAMGSLARTQQQPPSEATNFQRPPHVHTPPQQQRPRFPSPQMQGGYYPSTAQGPGPAYANFAQQQQPPPSQNAAYENFDFVDFNNLAMLNTDLSGLMANDSVWNYAPGYDMNAPPLNQYGP